MVGEDVVAFPDFVGAILASAEQKGAGVITRRDEDEIVDGQRGGGVDGGLDARSPVLAEALRAVLWVQRHQTLAGEKQEVANAVDSGSGWRRIAGFVVGGFPQLFAGVFVKSDDAGVSGADVNQEQVAL